MRHLLKKRQGTRATYHATFVRRGKRPGWDGNDIHTLLFTEIRDPDGSIVCDHLWFSLTEGWKALRLAPGDQVQFDARVTPYEKGYQGRQDGMWLGECGTERDWRLSRPTQMSKLPLRGDIVVLDLDPDVRREG